MSNIHIIGVLEGEEKDQEIGYLFEGIMKENFPNLVKEINMQSRKHRKSWTRWLQRGSLQETVITRIPKVTNKERILKGAREKTLVICREVPIRLSADFSKETFRQEGIDTKYSKSWKAGTYSQDSSTQQSCHLTANGRIKSFPDKKKLKDFIITKPLLYECWRGLFNRRRS